MKWKMSHIPKGNIIHITTKGNMTVEMLNKMVMEALKKSMKYNSRSFLVDHRKVIVSCSFRDTFERPKDLEMLGLPRESRVAEVVSKSDIEIFRFFETVSRNRGYQIHIFEDIKPAIEWLCS